MYNNMEEVTERVIEHYKEVEALGYNIVACFPQGSWNYAGLSDAESDVDTKCWVLPNLRDVILNKPAVSFTHVMENGEHADVKDVRLYFQLLKKQNTNFLEVLFCDNAVLNLDYVSILEPLFQKRELIANYNPEKLINACLGQIYNKQAALTHRYEGLKDKIDKYGYDGKQLSHAFRVLDMMQSLNEGDTFKQSLNSSLPHAEFLVKVKRKELDLINVDVAKYLMELIVDSAVMVKKDYLSSHTENTAEEVDALLEDVLIKLFEKNWSCKI